MEQYMIVSDNMTDLPQSYCEQYGLRQMYLTYMMDGETFDAQHQLPEMEFYAKMRGGSMPTTSQVNPENAKEFLLEAVKICRNIICISFSSGLSGTYNSTKIGAAEVMEENPECRIAVIDSLCASLGQGLLVHKALMMKENGASFEEVVNWVENHKLNIVHNFTVDDLFHLHRGGRVSKATAIIGTMINIKPLLHVDNEGHLTSVGKVRGRKKSIAALAEAMEQQIGSYREKNEIVFISHGDCEEDAISLKNMIEKKFGIQAFLINYVGPTIGAHSGPGTLALFYLGDRR